MFPNCPINTNNDVKNVILNIEAVFLELLKILKIVIIIIGNIYTFPITYEIEAFPSIYDK